MSFQNTIRTEWRILLKFCATLALIIAVFAASLAGYLVNASETAIKINRQQGVVEFASAIAIKVNNFDFATAAALAAQHEKREDVLSIYILSPLGKTVYDSRQEFDNPTTQDVLPIYSASDDLEGVVRIQHLAPDWLDEYWSVILVSVSSFMCVFFGSILALIFYIRRFIEQPILILKQGIERGLETKEYTLPDLDPRTHLGYLAHLCDDMHKVVISHQKEIIQNRQLAAMGTSVGRIAHELNNVLAVISANFDLVEMKLRASGDIPKEIDYIKQATLDAENISARLLAGFRREASGKREYVKISTTIDNLRRNAKPFLSGKSIKLNFSFRWDFVTYVNKADFEGSLLNMIKNAAEALQEDSGNISLTCSEPKELPESLSDDITYFSITVADDGPGVDAALLDQLFQPFVSGKKQSRGTGLGLWGASEFALSSGGRLTYRPNSPSGSAFVLILPASDELIPEVEVKIPLNSPALQGLTLLLLEDEKELMEAYKDWLTQFGANVVAADTVSQARELIGKYKFDVAILDLHLPDGTSLNLLPDFEKQGPIPLILLSGNPELREDQRHRITKILAKPLRLAKLTEVIVDLTGRELT